MPTSAPAETQAERRAWDLLTKNVRWNPPTELGVKVREGESASAQAPRLQIFEVGVAAVFARLRPDYEWWVTPNVPDGGSDFIGRQQFLEDEVLGIAAAITVGGQCKKRSRVDNVVQEVAGSLVNMVTTVKPTFFVIALSARVSKDRIAEARARVELAYQRHCHILDRGQVEGLLCEHLPVLEEVMRQGLTAKEIDEVRSYFAQHVAPPATEAVTAVAPERVLAGVPFTVTVSMRSATASAAASHLQWVPGENAEGGEVNLLGPLGADTMTGTALSGDDSDAPIEVRCSLELVTYSVGEVDLGAIRIGQKGSAPPEEWSKLGTVRVIENLRPRFYERPFRGALKRLDQEHDRALAGAVASIGVVGAGGSGKSRLVEEFALGQRQRGGAVVAAKQAKTLDDPHRIVADLLLGLMVSPPSLEDPAERVIRSVERYDSALAERAAPAIRSIFGSEEPGRGAGEQSLLSAILLLVAARTRSAPLIIHLQDLHWCSADTLLLLEKLVWQLGRILHPADAGGRQNGVLLIFEGRVRERQQLGEDGWDSKPFEALLQKLDCPTISCSFDQDQGLEFIRRLFEDRYSAGRRINPDLLELQGKLAERIHRAAGGNPFHSLEQVQFLKEQRILDQNPTTGLLYLIKPAPEDMQLPESVFDAIRLRWTYMQSRTPELALLVWAAGLLDDRIPTPLFRRLWRNLAPQVSLHDVDATEVLWTGEGQEDEVAFRHENYFRAVRRFEVSSEERERVVKIYCDLFAETKQAGRPVDRYKWALALLQLPRPDKAEAEALMEVALRDAEGQGDVRLARRIAAALLDLTWSRDEDAPLGESAFAQRCEDDLALTKELLGSDRPRAARRLDRLRDRIGARLERGQGPSEDRAELHRLQLTVQVRRSQLLFNDREPLKAAELAGEAVQRIQALRSGKTLNSRAWAELEMEALHSKAVALAIAGEIEDSLVTSAQAVEIAQTLSSPLSRHVVSTYANILMSRNPGESESILRRCLAELDDGIASTEAREATKINLGMALVLRVHRNDESAGREPAAMLGEAEEVLREVFVDSFQLGRYADAAAAALMLGIVSVMRDDGDEVSWFAQAVAAAARGRQMETLWRAHINLATALRSSGELATGAVRDHAIAALEILEETLAPYSEPDRSARFESVQVQLAQALRFLEEAGDREASTLLERYPALRETRDVTTEEDGEWRHEWWLRIGDETYALY